MVTVVTKTIGTSDRDFATFTLAEAAIQTIATAEFGGTDLVTADGAIVFEADAETFLEALVCNYSLTCDSTRNVTFCSASGGEAVISSSAGGPVVQVADGAFTALRGLKVVSTSTAGSARGVELFPASGKTCEGCVLDGLTLENTVTTNFVAIELQLEGSGAAGGVGSSSHPTIIQNCLEQGSGSGMSVVGGKSDELHAKVINCTFAGTGFNTFNILTSNDVTIEIVNCLNLGHTTSYRDGSSSGTVTKTGSNNFGGSNNPFPAAMQGTPYPITATTNTDPGAGDFAIFDSADKRLYNLEANDVWQAGVGPSANALVPTTDILGAPRSGLTATPGAFELGVGETIAPPAAPAVFSEPNTTPEFRVHLDRRVTDASSGVSSAYDSATNTTTFTLPYKLNGAATMQVVTRKTLTSNAGQSLTVVSTDAANRQVVVSGDHTGTPVFIGEQYTLKYEFSELHLQRGKNSYSAEPITAASHRVRYGRLSYGESAFFTVRVTAKGGTPDTYVFNGNLLNEPETQLGSIGLYDGHFQFPVMADHDRVTIELENDSPLPSRFLSCEWESFYHSRISLRSRF